MPNEEMNKERPTMRSQASRTRSRDKNQHPSKNQQKCDRIERVRDRKIASLRKTSHPTKVISKGAPRRSSRAAKTTPAPPIVLCSWAKRRKYAELQIYQMGANRYSKQVERVYVTKTIRLRKAGNIIVKQHILPPLPELKNRQRYKRSPELKKVPFRRQINQFDAKRISSAITALDRWALRPLFSD